MLRMALASLMVLMIVVATGVPVPGVVGGITVLILGFAFVLSVLRLLTFCYDLQCEEVLSACFCS